MRTCLPVARLGQSGVRVPVRIASNVAIDDDCSGKGLAIPKNR